MGRVKRPLFECHFLNFMNIENGKIYHDFLVKYTFFF